jgi:hypothetical protein
VTPEQLASLAVPGDRGLRRDDNERAGPAGPDLAKDDPEGAIAGPKPRMLLIPLVDRELLAQGRTLRGQVGPGQKRRPEKGDEGRKQCFHEVSKCTIEGGKL